MGIKNLINSIRASVLTSGLTLFRGVKHAIFTEWTTNNAVKHGYKKSPWVYIAVSRIASAVSSVPIVVYDSDDTILWDNELTALLSNKPNDLISRRKTISLITAWLQLTGRAYLINTDKLGESKGKLRTPERDLSLMELIPVSPNRLTPVVSSNMMEFISSYILDKDTAREVEISPDAVIYIGLLDPANPALGIGPLEASGKTVDTDNSFLNYSKASIDNGGQVDTIITFKDRVDNEEIKEYRETVKAILRDQDNFKVPLFLGSGADAKKLGALPSEMEYIQGRKLLKTEILDTFGFPTDLITSEHSTYNNRRESRKYFWETTVAGYLDEIADAINFYLNQQGYLTAGQYVGYDLTGISALNTEENERIDAAKKLWDMGVPFSHINAKYGLGIDDFDNNEVPYAGQRLGNDGVPDKIRSIPLSVAIARNHLSKIRSFKPRSFRQESEYAERLSRELMLPVFMELLEDAKALTFDAMDKGNPVSEALNDESFRSKYLAEIVENIRTVAILFAESVEVSGLRSKLAVYQKRELDEYTQQLIDNEIREQLIAEQALTQLSDDIINNVADILAGNIEQGLPLYEIQQALVDAGLFGESKAALYARTTTTTGQSIGQLSSARTVGATHKTWLDSGFNVRETHQNANNQTVLIDGLFDVGGYPAKYPGDRSLPGKERYNCRCSLTFSLQDQ